jgi:O-antigen/teichoic acid export membrane protein
LSLNGRTATLRDVLQIIAISWFVNYATMMVALFRQMQRLPKDGKFTFQRALHESLPMLGTNIAVVMMQTTDTMIVSLLIAPAEAAFYGVSSRLSAFLNVPAQIATNVVAPEISAAYVRNERDKLQRIVRTSATIAAVPAAGAGLILILGAPWILSFGFGPEYTKATPLLILLTLGQLGVILNGSVNMLLMLTGNQRVTMRLTALVAITSLLLQIVAALVAGTVGVAFVCAAMLTGLSVAQNQMSRKLVGVSCQAYLKWNPLMVAQMRS